MTYFSIQHKLRYSHHTFLALLSLEEGGKQARQTLKKSIKISITLDAYAEAAPLQFELRIS